MGVSKVKRIMLNQAIPEFELPATGGKTFKLSDYLGKTLVI